MTPELRIFRSGFIEADQVLTMGGEPDELWSGSRAIDRTVETHGAPDRRVHEMFMQADDAPEIQPRRHVHTRRT